MGTLKTLQRARFFGLEPGEADRVVQQTVESAYATYFRLGVV
jgi:hypothetical protein